MTMIPFMLYKVDFNYMNKNVKVFALANDDNIDVLELYDFFQNNKNLEISTKQIVKNFGRKYKGISSNLDFKEVPTKILILTKLYHGIIDKISKEYPKLNDFLNDFNNAIKKLSLIPLIVDRLRSFLEDELNIQFRLDYNQLAAGALKLIKVHQPISLSKLLLMMQKSNLCITEKDLRKAQEILFESGSIALKPKGLYYNESVIEDLDDDYNETINELLKLYLSEEEISEETLRNFKSIAERIPVSSDERKYLKILNNYQFSKKEARYVFGSQKTYAYMMLKYSPTPSKTFKDYVQDFELINDNIELNKIKNLGYIVVFGEVVKKDSLEVIRKFLSQKEFSILLKEDIQNIVKVIAENRITNKSESQIYDLVKHQISLIDGIYKIQNNYFLNLTRSDRFSDIFLNITERILTSIENILPVNELFSLLKKECEDEKIYNSTELFYVLKFQTTKVKIDYLIFDLCSLVILHKNFDIEDEAVRFLSETKFIKQSDFYSFFQKKYNLKEDSLNHYLVSFQKYFGDGENFNFYNEKSIIFHSDGIRDFVGGYFIDKKIFKTKITESKYNALAGSILKKSSLRGLRLNSDSNYIFIDKYETFEEAFEDFLNHSSRVIDESILDRKMDIQSVKLKKAISELKILKKSDFTYYNIHRFWKSKLLTAYRNEIVDFLEDDEIFTISSIKKDERYIRCRTKFSELDLTFIEDTLLSSIMSSSRELYKYNGNSDIFRKNSRVSKVDIIYKEIKEKRRLTQLDIEAVLRKKYGIYNCNISDLRKSVRTFDLYMDSEYNCYISREYYQNCLKEYIKNGEIE